jgi:hypothetical protein
MNDQNLILDGLERPTSAIAYAVSQQLRERYPDRALLEGSESDFDPRVFAIDGHCTLAPRPDVHAQFQTTWDGRRMCRDTANAWFEIRWREHSLDVVLMTWQVGFHERSFYWLLGPSRAVVEEFFQAVCAWCSEVRGEVLVFAGGCWRKDTELYESIQDTTFDNLILAGTLKQEIQSDVRDFFGAREVYERYRIPWKRGILFIGPPGNGKTHAVKALINDVRQPCLYVRSFKSQHSTDHDNIRAVFRRARKATPCVLVFEDLDALIDSGNRSYFLNELDGFAANTGIITLATTNHPERLDPAILDRPSRFDRKYHFELPDQEERALYLGYWNGVLQEELRIADEGIPELVELTQGFSFAYLKELILSSMIRWVHRPDPGGMQAVMASQVATLQQQMNSVEEEVTAADDGDDMAPFMPRGYRRGGRRWR